MDIPVHLDPGSYIVAVSGGVDSMALLHMLQSRPGLKLTVAHFEHGIRSDSDEDLRLVRATAAAYGLPFVYARGGLGTQVSEAAAREARYTFLRAARQAADARAVVTAHHQDDVLETAILNLVRGTGRRGLTSLRSTDIVTRPLLHVPKHRILQYARDNQLVWREDRTNADTRYRRNHIRHKVVPRLSGPHRQRLHDIIGDLHRINSEADELIVRLLVDYLATDQPGHLDRRRFIGLPHTAAREVMHTWLRQSGRIGQAAIDRQLIERLVHAAKTFTPGRRVSLNHNNYLFVGKDDLALVTTER